MPHESQELSREEPGLFAQKGSRARRSVLWPLFLSFDRELQKIRCAAPYASLFAEANYRAGANARVVLAVVALVIESGEKVIRFNQTN